MATRPDPKRNKPPSKGGSLFIGMMAGILIGLVIAVGLIWYFYTEPSGFRSASQAPAPITRAPEQGSAATSAAKAADPARPPAGKPAEAAKPAEASAPDYSFYDILPGNETPKPRDPPKLKEAWWLQVAALRKEADADALKAQLTLINMNAVVQSAQTANGVFFRVRVGPFANREATVAVQQTLVANKFEPRLLKENVTP